SPRAPCPTRDRRRNSPIAATAGRLTRGAGRDADVRRYRERACDWGCAMMRAAKQIVAARGNRHERAARLRAVGCLPFADEAMLITFWGVRGSVPWATAASIGHGCNTPCVEIHDARRGARLLLDAGSGIVGVGRSLGVEASAIPILLTHYHWDHTQGLP